MRSMMRLASAAALAILVSASMAPVSLAQTPDTNSEIQLIVSNVTLDDFCPQRPQSVAPAFDSALRTMTISGTNFNNYIVNNQAVTPVVTIGQGPFQRILTPEAARWDGHQIQLTINCADYNPTGTYRMLVSTGVGRPFNDGISFNFSLRGANGVNGRDGTQGPIGPVGPAGPQGAQGERGAA